MTEIITSINFWLIVIFVGALVWIIRQVIPKGVEEKRYFRILLKVGPPIIGGLLALIPVLCPIEGFIPSFLIGFIGGTFSQTAYGILRSSVPERIKELIGGKKNEDSESVNSDTEHS